MIGRREFITLLGGTAAGWPFGAYAQQQRMRRIGVLMGFAENDEVWQSYLASFKRGLEELGWAEGRNLRIYYRWAGEDTERTRITAEELVAAGINPARVLRVHPGAEHGLEVLEQTLRAGTCGAVLAWLEQGDAQTLDRLRQAAEAGNTWGVLFRTSNRSRTHEKPAKIPVTQMAVRSQLQMAIS